jgi:allantoin racemase
LTTTKAFRIWAQGATDQVAHRNYLAALLPHMKACCDSDFALEFKTMTPSVTTVHALSEFRFSRQVIRSAIQAERENYDVFFMNHFQDVGLYDARASVDIPVLGLGEATLLHACTMGRKLGLLAINPAFIPTVTGCNSALLVFGRLTPISRTTWRLSPRPPKRRGCGRSSRARRDA